MYEIDTETIIPKYPLAPNKVTGNTMLSVSKAKCAINYNVTDFLIPHRKDYYFLVFVKDGSSRHWIDMEPYILTPNKFYFSSPVQINLKEEPKPFTGMSIAFTEEFLALQENTLIRNLPVILNPHNGHELNLSEDDVIFIENTLEKIYTEYHTKNTWQHDMLMGYLQVLLIYLSRLYTEQFSKIDYGNDRMLLKKYLSKIEESYTELHEVAAYADLINISAGHLSEVIKEQSGESAITHIHKRLILEAKRLLFHTDHSIKEIAYRLGFEDASYFNRFFKRMVEQTPVAYRTTIRKMYH